MNLEITSPSKKCPKMTLALPGVHFVYWGALTNFPCKLRLFFLRPGGAGAPTMPMDSILAY